MAKNIQDLRREAGYSSAKDFAAALGIPQSTYARYENQPEAIPLKQAWAIADFLGCSIDIVVGREPVDVDAMRGEFQKYYDSLSPESQSLLEQIAAVLKGNDRFRAKAARTEEQAKFDKYLDFYERAFFESLETGSELGDVLVFGTEAERRAAFERYLVKRAAAKRAEKVAAECGPKEDELLLNAASIIDSETGEEIFCDDPRFDARMEEIIDGMRALAEHQYEEEDRETIAKIMAAYDRRHHIETPSIQRRKEMLMALLDKYGKEPASAHPEAIQRGKDLIMSLFAEGGDIALSDLRSEDDD